MVNSAGEGPATLIAVMTDEGGILMLEDGLAKLN